jgi:hypothetical protein
MKSLFSNGKALAILAGITVLVAVVTSIALNPPSEIRARSLDRVRLNGLRSTEIAVGNYYGAHHALPVGLDALGDENRQLNYKDWHDPETQRPFEYEIVNETTYKLCAVFSRSSDNDGDVNWYSFKRHKAGLDCFQQSVSQNGQ